MCESRSWYHKSTFNILHLRTSPLLSSLIGALGYSDADIHGVADHQPKWSLRPEARISVLTQPVAWLNQFGDWLQGSLEACVEKKIIPKFRLPKPKGPGDGNATEKAGREAAEAEAVEAEAVKAVEEAVGKAEAEAEADGISPHVDRDNMVASVTDTVNSAMFVGPPPSDDDFGTGTPPSGSQADDSTQQQEQEQQSDGDDGDDDDGDVEGDTEEQDGDEQNVTTDHGDIEPLGKPPPSTKIATSSQLIEQFLREDPAMKILFPGIGKYTVQEICKCAGEID